jgi:hypothetical protein
MWRRAKELADVKVMLHCCGGVRPLLDHLIDAGMDALNPVQISCGGMDSSGLKNDFGFFTPLDLGKRAVLEYDYYMDQTDPDEIKRMQQAVMAAGEMIEGFSRDVTGVRWIKYVFNQGFARKEGFLYT